MVYCVFFVDMPFCFGSYDGDEEGLWLHCVRYTGPDWSYECPYPDWAFLGSVSTKKMKS